MPKPLLRCLNGDEAFPPIQSIVLAGSGGTLAIATIADFCHGFGCTKRDGMGKAYRLEQRQNRSP